MTEPIDLSTRAGKLACRAQMARAGIAPQHLRSYDDAERGWVNPLADEEAQYEVRKFLYRLWDSAHYDGDDDG